MDNFLKNMKDWTSLLPQFTLTSLVEIIILAFFIYECLLWIKNTHAWQLLKGLLVIGLFIIFAAVCHLETIMWLIERVSTVAIIGAIVIFQPELRKALEQLGSRNFFQRLFPTDRTLSSSSTVDEIVKGTFSMAKKRTGALIVIQCSQPLKDIEDTGIQVDGIVTSALLINIFEKNTPLHDGAVVIVGDRVTFATCYLPLSEKEISKDYGTRHRAALGISEVTDAVTIVVSEETGRVSVALNGELIPVPNAEMLKNYLPYAGTNNPKESGAHFRFFKKETRA